MDLVLNEPEIMSYKNVSVVGAGIAGIIAAYFEVRKGHNVTLIDSDARAGGLLKSDFLNGKYFDCTLACSGISTLFAFWLYNRPPARIFMGDGGSLVIGFIIACCAIRACNMEITEGVNNPVFVLCILAYPAVDTLRVFAVRIFSGKSPFSADRNHIHHLLIDKGFNHGWASFFAVMYCAVLTLICFFLINYPNLSFFIMVGLALLFIILPMASFARSTTKKILSFFK